MSDPIVDQIKAALDVVEVIGESVRLTKKGRNYTGLCPFHDEKTPSFMVSQERQSWHCFGCGKGGDLFSFVMLKDGLSFPEALEYLAARAGIDLPRQGRRHVSKDLFALMEEAVSFYRQELRGPGGAAARAYLERRNVSPEAAAAFELGWAPNAWQSLSDQLKRGGASEASLLKAGLVIQGNRGNCYDRFRGRVIFPIRNVPSRVVALGGRLIDGEGAKYLNSPEGELYSKKNNLYLLDRAKESIREKGRSILVEGYMDALRLHLCGWAEGVASLGTALTEDQAALLRRFADKCYICYDSDLAGQTATLRGMYLLASEGLTVYVVTLPEGKDPDELLQMPGGPESFTKALDGALPLVSHHIKLFRAQAEQDGVTKASRDLLESLSALSSLDLSPHRAELCQALGLTDYQLRQELERFRRPVRADVKRSETAAPQSKTSQRDKMFHESEACMTYLLWSQKGLRGGREALQVPRLLETPLLQDIAAALLSGSDPGELESRWLQLGETAQKEALTEGEYSISRFGSTAEEQWNVLLSALLRRATERRYAALKEKILRGEATEEEVAQWGSLSRELKCSAKGS